MSDSIDQNDLLAGVSARPTLESLGEDVRHLTSVIRMLIHIIGPAQIQAAIKAQCQTILMMGATAQKLAEHMASLTELNSGAELDPMQVMGMANEMMKG